MARHMIVRGGAGERRQGPHACAAAFTRNLSQCVHKQRNLKTQCYERTWSWHTDAIKDPLAALTDDIPAYETRLGF